jgi:hypothetical protein
VSDRDLAQQWLAEVLHQAGTGGCDCGLAEPGDRDFYSGILAAAILDTPGVEVETMTMYVGKPGGSWVAETRLHIMLPVESVHV